MGFNIIVHVYERATIRVLTASRPWLAAPLQKETPYRPPVGSLIFYWNASAALTFIFEPYRVLAFQRVCILSAGWE
ncbi:hypothetical protein GCM10008018_46340 [Paenibacillus marchantiophytorum]|uniref:Uncharacterized protein n=1 Tax=Paenibacillus marchantiophytorum TaxID=1619310 RepID=A0ABQ1F072_9BACL|nr:hypothetical protein GCM10008018_46340 [Paenibacillus marchantiophytorum]